MAQMPFALCAMGLCAHHAVAGIFVRGNGVGFCRPKGRPATTTFILGVRAEQQRPTGRAMIRPLALFMIQWAGTGILRSVAKQNLLLLWGKRATRAAPTGTAAA